MWNLIYILVIFCVLTNSQTNAKYDYCEYNCANGGKHILCARQNENCSLDATRCNPRFEYFAPEQRENILDTMNKIRDKIASGGTKYPKAANMRALRWCFELEYIAQCRSNTCHFSGLEYCYNTRNVVASIIFGVSDATDKYNDTDWIREYFEDWLSEQEKIYPIENIYNSSTDSSYVLKIFAFGEAETLGCGYSEEQKGGKMGTHISPMTEPEGNTLHITCIFGNSKYTEYGSPAPVYEVGEPCSRCVAARCNSKYKHLCGEVLPIDRELGARYRAGDRANADTLHSAPRAGAVMWILICLFVTINFYFVHL